MGMLILLCFSLGFLFVYFNEFNVYEVIFAWGKVKPYRKLQNEKWKFSIFPQDQSLLFT